MTLTDHTWLSWRSQPRPPSCIGFLIALWGLVSCAVYEDASFERKTKSAHAREKQADAARDAQGIATGCSGRRCDAGPETSRGAASDAALDAARVVPENRGEVQRAADAGVIKPHANSADTGNKASAADSGKAPEIDSGLDAHMTAEESGVCAACDSTTPADPVLDGSGGSGNVTSSGNVMAPAPSAGGACNYGSTAIFYFAAINVHAQAGDANGQWQGGKICGQCAEVRVKTPTGWKETFVRIVDKCSDAYCGISLSGAAASAVMGDRPGRYEGHWRFVSCAGHAETSDGPPAIYVKEGSSAWWALVQVRNAAQAVTSIEWQTPDAASSGTFPYASEAENYFSVPEAVRNSDKVRLTVRYRDTTTAFVEVSASQLTTPESVIALP